MMVISIFAFLRDYFSDVFWWLNLYSGKSKLGSDKEHAETVEEMKKSMTNEEWETVYKMSEDKNLYDNLIKVTFEQHSFFFSIHCVLL